MFDEGGTDGVRHAGTIGTYLHGALEHAQVCAEVFGVTPADVRPKSDHYERLADWFEAHARHLSELEVFAEAVS
jgi:hypothetical protein